MAKTTEFFNDPKLRQRHDSRTPAPERKAHERPQPETGLMAVAAPLQPHDLQHTDDFAMPRAGRRNLATLNSTIPSGTTRAPQTVFDASKANSVVRKLGTTPGGRCAHKVCDILDATGIHVRDTKGNRLGKASEYSDVLPKYGFKRIDHGDGGSFNVRRLRQSMQDPNRPVVVVMHDKSKPDAGGHIFYVAADDKTYSDFKQKSPTGLLTAKDFTYQAFAYNGPVRDYETPALNRAIKAVVTKPGPGHA